MAEKKSDKGDEPLSPRSVYSYSLFLMTIIVLPLTIGVSYILNLGNKLFNGPAEYSVLFGLGAGALLSIVLGYIYGRMAIKELEG
ncbi:MAG: hypothetical protein J7L88_03735 [Thermoplasmata archaeon]|nr:hypothetical protein [Thermoplasmata archaeon]